MHINFFLKKLFLVCGILFSVQIAAFAQEQDSSDMFVAVEKEPGVDMQLLSKKIIYPEEARRNRIEGKVVIQVLIDKTGKPTKTQIREAVHPLLDSAAANAVMSIDYTPAIASGKPVSVWVAIPIKFTLNSWPLFNTNTTEPKKETPVTEPK